MPATKSKHVSETGASVTRRSVAMMCESDALGGAEMVIYRLAQALYERGYHVVGVGPDEVTQPDRGSNGWLRAKFAEAGFPWRMYRKRRPIDRGLVYQLAYILRDLHVEVVHSHEFGMAVYGTVAARRVGIPHVISMHGNSDVARRWTRRMALRWAFARSQATIAVSEQTREHLETELGVRSGQIQVIRNGVPKPRGDRVAGRKSVGVRDDEILILAVGSLIRRKGHALLLQALRSVDATPGGTPWRLAIAGAGEERKALEAYVRELGLEGRADLLGPRDDVADLLAAADVFTMPSLWEGLPLALLEAMLAGKPIVASDVSGIPEAIDHERQGLLVPPGDVAGLASALRRVLADPRLRETLGSGAKERAAREFSIDAMTDGYERVYRAGA